MPRNIEKEPQFGAPIEKKELKETTKENIEESIESHLEFTRENIKDDKDIEDFVKISQEGETTIYFAALTGLAGLKLKREIIEKEKSGQIENLKELKDLEVRVKKLRDSLYNVKRI